MARRLTDWTLFFTILLMTAMGLIMVYSASSVPAVFKGNNPEALFLRQLAAAVLSFLVMMWLKRQNYLLLKDPLWAFAPLGIVIAMLPLAYFLDPKTHRWIRLGFMQLQPSEFAKPALIVFLAYFLTRRLPAINSRFTLMPVGMMLVVLAGIVLQADLGTAIALLVPALVLFIVAGLKLRYVAYAGLLAGVVMAYGIWDKPYRLARVIEFVDPEMALLDQIDTAGIVRQRIANSHSTRDPGYQIFQAKIATGSGGVLGMGIMQGRQKILYLPEPHTDMIFAIVGEELGLWGATAMLGGFFVIFWRGIRLFWLSKNDFGKFLALGISVSILVQALINISVVLGLGPAKGIPLPLISYGGSSLLSTLISLGILLSVSEDAQWLESVS